MNKIKVAIDSGTLKSGDSFRGIGFHTRNLVESLKGIDEVDVELVDAKNTDLSYYDLIHYQKFHPYFFSFPFLKQAKSVITIHDLIYLIYPKNYPAGIRGKIRFIVQKLLLKQMDAIITISETSKKDICRFLGVHPYKVHVIYLAPRKIFRKIVNTTLLYSIVVKYKLPKKFVLYVGDVNFNKNIPVLLKACEMAKVPLVICGKQAKDIENQNLSHLELKHLKLVIKDLQNNKNVIRLGFVSDKDLVAIYNLATVYVQASLYEGFGLPILEAFASGVPVVASRINTHVEIAGDTAVFADPKDPQDIAKKIEELIKDQKLRNEMIKKGFRKVKEYTWEKTAEETFKVYQRVITLS